VRRAISRIAKTGDAVAPNTLIEVGLLRNGEGRIVR
jgi:hypothetical protein